MPLLAKTFETIADDPHAMYNGSLADDVVADIQEAGNTSPVNFLFVFLYCTFKHVFWSFFLQVELLLCKTYNITWQLSKSPW